MKFYNFTIACLLLLFLACTKDKGKDPSLAANKTGCDTVTYSVHIEPLISANCVSCHDAVSGNADLSTHTGLKAQVDNGGIASRVFTIADMPPSGPLSNEQLQLLKCWMDSGAPNN